MERLEGVRFLTIAVCLAVASVLWSGRPVEAQTKKIVLKIGHILPNDSAEHQGAVKFAELMAQKTAGQVEVQVFPNSQLGNAKSQLQAVAIGGQDIFMDGIGWYVD